MNDLANENSIYGILYQLMNDLKTTVNVQEYHSLTKVKSEDLLEVIIKKLTELKSQIQEKNSKPTSPPVYRLSSASLKPKPHFKKVVKTSEDSQEKCLKISHKFLRATVLSMIR